MESLGSSKVALLPRTASQATVAKVSNSAQRMPTLIHRMREGFAGASEIMTVAGVNHRALGHSISICLPQKSDGSHRRTVLQRAKPSRVEIALSRPIAG